MDHTKEAQYVRCQEVASERVSSLGLMSNQVWFDDPRRLTFVLARYKFVSKMLSGMKNVLEVGCADAFGTRLVQQEVGAVTATDIDPLFVADVLHRMDSRWKFECLVHDMLAAPLDRGFDGAYLIDVLEHIPAEKEERFIGNIVHSLGPEGVCIAGSPSIQSQAYASPPSRAGHVNCKDAAGMKGLFSKFFHNVFIFSMNDEVVHTGFYPMAHYLFALCCHRIT